MIFGSDDSPAAIDDGDISSDLKVFGGKAEEQKNPWMPPPKKKEPKVREFLVLEENLDAVTVFMNMATQWNVGGMGSIVGLNYSALETVFRIFRIKNSADCFSRVRVMEAEALRLIREQEKQKDG